MRPTSQRDVHLPASSPASPAQSTDPRRRRFLLALGAGGAASAAAVAPAIAAPVADAVAAERESKSGYRETEHVRTYYATTRL